MTLDDFHAALAGPAARGYDLNDEQKEAVDHTGGPLWIIAGPGSGKSEVLVTRSLRLMCVDGVAPSSILLTTFTKKAARNLEDRLGTYLAALRAQDPLLSSVDLAELRIGTLHGLANDILQEYRYPDYQNVRLLDSVDQAFFTYKRAAIAGADDPEFWAPFNYLFSRWKAGASYAPNKWQRVKAATILFNRVVEDRVSLDLMRAAGGSWATLADYYVQYR